MGRNRGLGVTLINQRAATLNKDVLTQIDTLLAFRNVAPQDRQALRDWVEYHAAEGDFEEFMKSLPSLPTGEGWIWSPEFMGIFERIKIRERETFHPDRENLDRTFVMPKLEMADVSDFIMRFQRKTDPPPAVAQEASANNLSAERVRELEEENETLVEQHEQEIEAKDRQITELQAKTQELQGIVNAIENILKRKPSENHIPLQSTNSTLDLWIGKLGTNSGETRILKLLAERRGQGFTRKQLAIAIGAGYDSVRKAYVPKLKKALLIKEVGDRLQISDEV